MKSGGLRIDLNCDMGELPEAIADGTQESLMRSITSVNIACGGHAGDEHTMRTTIEQALRWKLAIGAHPGYPDRANFGRLESKLPWNEIAGSVFEQVRTLAQIAAGCGSRLVHVKPHGALYNQAVHDRGIAEAIAEGVARWSRDVILAGLAGSPMLDVFREAGFAVAAEALAEQEAELKQTMARRKAERDEERAKRKAAWAEAIAKLTPKQRVEAEEWHAKLEAGLAKAEEAEAELLSKVKENWGTSGNPSETHTSSATLEKLTDRRTILGYDCEHYVITLTNLIDGKAASIVTYNYWVASALHDPSLAARDSFAEQPDGHRNAPPELKGFLDHRRADDEIHHKGVSLAYVVTSGGPQTIISSEAIEVSKEPIDPAVFSVPAGYTKVDRPGASMIR